MAKSRLSTDKLKACLVVQNTLLMATRPCVSRQPRKFDILQTSITHASIYYVSIIPVLRVALQTSSIKTKENLS